MEFKEKHRIEVYENEGWYVACVVNKSNDFVVASSKQTATPEHAREEAVGKLTLAGN